MKSGCAGFNLNLVSLLLVIVSMGLGCKSAEEQKKKAEEGDSRNQSAILRFHLEVNPDGTDRNGPMTITRSSPFTVNIERAPFLDEKKVKTAALVEDDFGGFQIVLGFERQGAWLLEHYTTSYRGRRIAIFAAFREQRWLAAPVITKTITNGVFAFTPDASRAEAQRLVQGLINVARKENN